MYNKEFEKIYEAIGEIYEESEYSGWHNIADNIIDKLKLLENSILIDERLRNISIKWNIPFEQCDSLYIELINKTNYSEEECIDIIEGYLNDGKTFYDIIRFYEIEEVY